MHIILLSFSCTTMQHLKSCRRETNLLTLDRYTHQAKMSRRILKSVSDESWAELYKRFVMNDFNYKKILSSDLYTFINKLSKGNGTCFGYVLMSILTTINYIASNRKCSFEVSNEYKINLNTFFVLVGEPSTGKSPAIKVAVTEPIFKSCIDI